MIDRGEFANKFICVASIDVDDLGKINKSFGEEVGDRSLKALGQKLIILTRSYDFVCRRGGDEFRIIAVFSRKSDMNKFEDRLREGLRIIKVEDINLSVSATMTCSSVQIKKGMKIHELDKRSNLEMYDMKGELKK